MPSFNKVILIGNLTRDPELRYTPKGTAVAKIGLAVNRSWKDAESGEMREEVTFIDVTAFGRQAETVAQYVKKGRPLMIEGRLKLDTWEDKTTHEKKSKLGVVMESFQFLDGGQSREPREQRDAAPPSSGRPTAQSDVGNPPPGGDLPPEDDDVPF